MAKTVTINVDTGDGRISIDDGVLFVGERAHVVFSGYAVPDGHSIRIIIYDTDSETPIADNHIDASVLALDTEALRVKFTDQKPRVYPAFAYEVDDATGASTGMVYARGFVTIHWSPLVFEESSSNPVSFKGDRGDSVVGVEVSDVTKAGKKLGTKFTMILERVIGKVTELFRGESISLIRKSWQTVSVQDERGNSTDFELPALGVESVGTINVALLDGDDKKSVVKEVTFVQNKGWEAIPSPDMPGWIGPLGQIIVPDGTVEVLFHESSLQSKELGSLITDTVHVKLPDLDGERKHNYSVVPNPVAVDLEQDVVRYYKPIAYIDANMSDYDFKNAFPQYADKFDQGFIIRKKITATFAPDGLEIDDPGCYPDVVECFVDISKDAEYEEMRKRGVFSAFIGIGFKFNKQGALQLPDVSDGMAIGNTTGIPSFRVFQTNYGELYCSELQIPRLEGAAGAPGTDGVSVQNVVLKYVDSTTEGYKYRLSVALTDGQTIDAGVFLAPRGAPGAPGEPGEPGEPGKDGSDPNDGKLTFYRKGSVVASFSADSAFDVDVELGGSGAGTIRLWWYNGMITQFKHNADGELLPVTHSEMSNILFEDSEFHDCVVKGEDDEYFRLQKGEIDNAVSGKTPFVFICSATDSSPAKMLTLKPDNTVEYKKLSTPKVDVTTSLNDAGKGKAADAAAVGAALSGKRYVTDLNIYEFGEWSAIFPELEPQPTLLPDPDDKWVWVWFYSDTGEALESDQRFATEEEGQLATQLTFGDYPSQRELIVAGELAKKSDIPNVANSKAGGLTPAATSSLFAGEAFKAAVKTVFDNADTKQY